MNDDFMLDGWSYQKKFRYCNKPVCKCHDGQPHGPYWYRSKDGQLLYVGKNLSQLVIDALSMRDVGRSDALVAIKDIDQVIREQEKRLSLLREKKESLRAALSGGSLSEREIKLLKEMSFSTLVPPALLVGKQLGLT